MFSYRHGFHAGNHADVLKHMVLVQLLAYLNQKDARIFLVQISEQLYEYHVLEHIGVIPSVEAVAITEHRVRQQERCGAGQSAILSSPAILIRSETPKKKPRPCGARPLCGGERLFCPAMTC